MRFLRAICRFLFGFLFIISGFLKGIDPIGSALKIKEYLMAFHLGSIDFLSIPGAVLLSTAEFLVGVAILKGLRIQFFSKVALWFISFFTLLTLIIAIFNPVTDCGCFGEAFHLSNTATFIKNLCLLAAGVLIYLQRKKFQPIASPKVEWSYLVAYGILIVTLQVYSLKNLPQIDFGIYKPGTDLITSRQGNQEREYQTTFIYSKDGKEESFTLDNLPDSTWTYVDTHTVLVSGEPEDSSTDLSFIDAEGNGTGNEILNKGGAQFFVSIYNAGALGEKSVNRLVELADTIAAHNLVLYVISANTVEDTQEIFASLTDNQRDKFQIFYADYKAVISLNRSNGGLTYINDGIIVEKWARSNYPLSSIGEILLQDPEIITATSQINERLFAEIFLFIILFLIVIIRFFSKIIYGHSANDKNNNKDNYKEI